MGLVSVSLHRTLVLMVSAGILFLDTNVTAADRIVLKYRIFRESLSVQELTTFATTGELSSDLRVNLALARQDPKVIRQYLTAPVKVDPVLLDRGLNSKIGIFLLDQLAQTIHTPSRRADRQALRSALILSASRDRQLTLLETIQNYPTSEVEVEGDRLESAYRLLHRLQGIMENLP